LFSSYSPVIFSYKEVAFWFSLNLSLFMQFSIGQEVWLLNPQRSSQKVAVGTVSGIGGEQKFHFREIPERWFKVDVREALQRETTLMCPNEDADQAIIGDVVGTIWDQKFMKLIT
jgi:hypothetical protein